MRFTPLLYVLLVAFIIIVIVKFFTFNAYYSPTLEFYAQIDIAPYFSVEINLGRPGHGSGYLSHKFGLLKDFFRDIYRIMIDNIELTLLGITILIVLMYPKWFKKS